MTSTPRAPEGQPPSRGPLLKRPEVERYCGISRSEIYRRLDAGTFPQPRRIGTAIRWAQSDLDAWIDALPVG